MYCDSKVRPFRHLQFKLVLIKTTHCHFHIFNGFFNQCVFCGAFISKIKYSNHMLVLMIYLIYIYFVINLCIYKVVLEINHKQVFAQYYLEPSRNSLTNMKDFVS